MKRKLAIGMVAVAVLAVVVISLVLVKSLNNRRVEGTGVSKVIEINSKDKIPEVELEDTILSEYYALLSASIVKGNSKDMVKESNSKAYQFFILKGEEAFDFLKAQIKSENITVRKKIAAEWLISDIIKAQRNEGEIRVEYWKAVTKNDCSGKIAPDEASNVWSSLPSNTVLQITGMLSMDWYMAKRISPLQADQLSPDFLGTDEVEFWINSKDLYYNSDFPPIYFENVQYSNACEYTSIVKENIEETYSIGLDQMVQQVGIYETPSDQGPILGYAFSNDLIRCVKDDMRKDIRLGEWILVEKIPFYGDPSDTGWIKESNLLQLEAGMKPNQGFILRHTKVEAEREDPYLPEFINESGIACVHIRDRKDGLLKINGGINSFSAWVKEEDVYYQMTSEIEEKVYFSEPDYDLFMTQLKKDIQTNPLFTLRAEDNAKVVVLTDDEKIALANALMSVGDGFAFDGGINENREVAYPFYRLDFGSYSMVITTKDQLLLQLDKNISYDYGIGREGAPFLFVTPNIEFIEVLRELLPMSPNIDEGKFDYLMNAIGLTIDDKFITIDSVIVENQIEQAQINKVARSLRNAAGEVLTDEVVDQEAAVFDFIFEDGRTIRITYTDQYIEFNGQYYKALKSRSDFMTSLFAAYF